MEKSLVKISLLLFVNIVLHKLSTIFVDNINNPVKTDRSMDCPCECAVSDLLLQFSTFVSGHANEVIEREGGLGVGVEILVKPILPFDLLQKIQELKLNAEL